MTLILRSLYIASLLVKSLPIIGIATAGYGIGALFHFWKW